MSILKSCNQSNARIQFYSRSNNLHKFGYLTVSTLDFVKQDDRPQCVCDVALLNWLLLVVLT